MLLTGVVALLIAVSTLIATAAIYAFAGRRSVDCDAAPPLSVAAATWAFVCEWLASLALVIAVALPARAAAGRVSGRIAVLIPELRSSSRGFWYLRRRLRAAGWSCVAGLARTRSTSLSEAIAALDACMERQAGSAELVLIGHGIGGLLAHRYARERPGLPIRHVVTLATPHRGSRSLPYRLLCRLAQPAAGPPPAGTADVDVIAVYSAFDAWLVPIDDAYCPGGFNVEVRGLGHCAMLLSRRIADLVVENIAQPMSARSADDATAPAAS